MEVIVVEVRGVMGKNVGRTRETDRILDEPHELAMRDPVQFEIREFSEYGLSKPQSTVRRQSIRPEFRDRRPVSSSADTCGENASRDRCSTLYQYRSHPSTPKHLVIWMGDYYQQRHVL